MKIVSREQYMRASRDLERYYLFSTKAGCVYLRSDIEYGGELQSPRIEVMQFAVDTTIGIKKAVDKSRGENAGRILLFEHKTPVEAYKKVMGSFTDFAESVCCESDTVFLECRDDELRDIVKKYPNNNIYVVVMEG